MVSALTGVLAGLSANLEDTAMTRLEGQFAMMLVVALPEGGDRSALEAAINEAATRLGLSVVVRPVTTPGPNTDRGSSHSDLDDGVAYRLTVYGADRPGIVHRITSTLADLDVNIVDLATRVIASTSTRVYAMLLELSVPATVDLDDLRRMLKEAADELGVDHRLESADADIF
jgi:glycine cleavage system transcriptional repressor